MTADRGRGVTWRIGVTGEEGEKGGARIGAHMNRNGMGAGVGRG